MNIPGALLEYICQLDKSLHVKYFLNSKNEMDLCMNVKRETQKLSLRHYLGFDTH